MFSVCSSDVHYIQRSRTGLQFLGENIIGNINVNYFELEPVIQGDMCFKEKVLKARQITKRTMDARRYSKTKTHHKSSPKSSLNAKVSYKTSK